MFIQRGASRSASAFFQSFETDSPVQRAESPDLDQTELIHRLNRDVERARHEAALWDWGRSHFYKQMKCASVSDFTAQIERDARGPSPHPEQSPDAACAEQSEQASSGGDSVSSMAAHLGGLAIADSRVPNRCQSTPSLHSSAMSEFQANDAEIAKLRRDLAALETKTKSWHTFLGSYATLGFSTRDALAQHVDEQLHGTGPNRLGSSIKGRDHRSFLHAKRLRSLDEPKNESA